MPNSWWAPEDTSIKYQWLLHYSLGVLDCYSETLRDAGIAKSCDC